MLTLYYPIISLRIRDLIRDYEIRSMAHDPSTWDEDWVRGYAAYEDQERSRTWREERASQSWYTGTNADPKGYYRTLNVSPNASQSEIQGAFRG
jgi:hypothetical protein